MSDYAYSVASDFGSVISSTCLTDEIEASSIVPILDSITIVDDDVTITFLTTLSGAEEIVLDGVVSAHDSNCNTQQEQNDAINTNGVIYLGSPGNAGSGRYLEPVHNIGSNLSPIMLNIDSTLASLTIALDNVETGDIEVYKDGILATTLSLSAQSEKRANDLNIAFEAGTKVSAKVSTGSFKDPILTLWFNQGIG